MDDISVIYRAIDSIKPYEKNPRKIGKAVNYVMASIKEFGFRVPLVIDCNGVIVCGHVRYAAAKKLKLAEVPCVIADDLTAEQIQAFRVIDNKTQELSTWDFGKLISELEELTDAIDMSPFGFDEAKSEKTRNGEAGQDLDDSEELDLGDFDDDGFAYTCPCCGFKFND